MCIGQSKDYLNCASCRQRKKKPDEFLTAIRSVSACFSFSVLKDEPNLMFLPTCMGTAHEFRLHIPEHLMRRTSVTRRCGDWLAHAQCVSKPGAVNGVKRSY